MNDRPFARFIDLVNLDQKIQSLSDHKNVIEKEISSIEEQETFLKKSFEELQKKVFQLKKTVDMQELELRELDQKEREKKQRLDQLSDYKEYQAIKNEVDIIQQMQVEKEKMVMNAWNQLENAQAALEKKEVENKQAIEQLLSTLKEQQDRSKQVTDEIDQLTKERKEKEINIPEEWLEKYNLMHSQVANPVVPIIQQSCSGCYQMIVSQDFVRAKHAALLQCKKCFRLLYLPEAMGR